MIAILLLVILSIGDSTTVPQESRTTLKIVEKAVPLPQKIEEQPLGEKPRLEALATLSVATIPVSHGYCDTSLTVLGCYDTILDEIIITDSGLAYSNDKVVCIIQHEMRHYWQDINNLIQFDENGLIINKDWIEYDADTNGCS